MMCCVITRFHQMMGVDFHASALGFPIPIPPPVPQMVHMVSATVRFGIWFQAKDKESEKVDTYAGAPMSKIFDIGMFIPHLGINHPIVLGFLSACSSSQGHFGVASVITDKGPIAVALDVCVNPQLNCNDFLLMPIPFPLPVPLPTGLLHAPNTVVAGLTLGDVFAGYLSMVMTSAATMVIGGLIGAPFHYLPPILKPKLGSLMGPMLTQLNNRLPTHLFSKLLQGSMTFDAWAATKGGKAFITALGDHITDPVQNALTNVGVGLVPIQSGSDAAGRGVDSVADPLGLNDYYNNPLIPGFP